MPKQFRTLLHGSSDSSATYVLVPATIMKTFGGKIRVPVRVSINGAEHRTTICNMGMGPMIGIPAALRKAAGIDRGQRIAVTLETDDAERTVTLPKDFAKAMSGTERRAYDKMSYTHRKEYVMWIEDAKKLETRARRIEVARAKLRERAAKLGARASQLAVLVVAAVTLCTAGAFAQSSNSVSSATTAQFTIFFRDLLAGRTPSGISDAMRSGLTPDLKKDIDTSFQAFGSFRRLQYASQETMEGYHRYHYLAIFDKGKPGVIFVTDSKGTIVGFFQDSPPASPAPPPDAALTARFTSFFQDILAHRVPSTPMIPKMRSSLTPANISQIDQTFASYGAFKDLTYVAHDTLQGYQRYHYRANFAKGSQGLMFVTDASGAIAGFFKDQS
jgi:bifunctional DNA-binding transcriptional regulator/antitoxin component of YhaV-PrlF toxin-antitoxin module